MSEIGYFQYVKNKIDKFSLSLHSIRKSKRCGLRLPLRRDNSDAAQIQKVTEYPYLP